MQWQQSAQRKLIDALISNEAKAGANLGRVEDVQTALLLQILIELKKANGEDVAALTTTAVNAAPAVDARRAEFQRRQEEANAKSAPKPKAPFVRPKPTPTLEEVEAAEAAQRARNAADLAAAQAE